MIDRVCKDLELIRVNKYLCLVLLYFLSQNPQIVEIFEQSRGLLLCGSFSRFFCFMFFLVALEQLVEEGLAEVDGQDVVEVSPDEVDHFMHKVAAVNA